MTAFKLPILQWRWEKIYTHVVAYLRLLCRLVSEIWTSSLLYSAYLIWHSYLTEGFLAFVVGFFLSMCPWVASKTFYTISFKISLFECLGRSWKVFLFFLSCPIWPFLHIQLEHLLISETFFFFAWRMPWLLLFPAAWSVHCASGTIS